MDNKLQQNFTGISWQHPTVTGDPPPPPSGNAGEGEPPPWNPKSPRRFPHKVSAMMILVLLAAGVILLLSQANIRQIISGKAWSTANTAIAQCTSLGKVVINFSFTNKEASKAMLVVAKDSQTGLSSDLGKVLAGETKTGMIETTLTSLKSGIVSFKMTWVDDASSTDTVEAGYSSVSTCSQPTSIPTPRPTSTPTPKPSTNPTSNPTNSPTTTPTPSSPTITICPTPGTVKNIQIKCPYCTPSPSPN